LRFNEYIDMKQHIFIIFLFFSFCFYGQYEMHGVWQGIIIQNGKSNAQSNPFFLLIETNAGKITGLSREEIFDTDFYSIGKLYGTVKNDVFEWKHVVFQKKIGNSRITWCKLNAKLSYNKNTGYLEGTYSSSDCRNIAGKIILFRSKAKFSDGKNSFISQNARDILVKDLSENRPAPAIREMQRLNFKFQPIYFDFDKAFIRQSDIYGLK
jgi:OOP family OmpA-OmpF porin